MLELAKGSRHEATKSVRIKVKQNKVRKQAKITRQSAGKVLVVKVNTNDRDFTRVLHGGLTENTNVATNVRARPRGGNIMGVGKDKGFP